MVSDGHEFKLSIPGTNKFYIGHNQVIKDTASSPLDTLRPQAIYDALLLQRIDPESEIAVLESSQEMVVDKQTHKLAQQPNYVLDAIRRPTMAGPWHASWSSIASTLSPIGRSCTTSTAIR